MQGEHVEVDSSEVVAVVVLVVVVAVVVVISVVVVVLLVVDAVVEVIAVVEGGPAFRGRASDSRLKSRMFCLALRCSLR